MSRTTDECKRFLLVEGNDDVHVIGQLLKLSGVSTLRNLKKTSIKPSLQIYLNENIPLDIQPCDGASPAIRDFTAKIKGFNSLEDSIGLVLDNDQGSNRVVQVKNAIDRIIQETSQRFRWKLDRDYEILTPGGFIAEPDNADTPRIGCWLMPDHQSYGMLETFLATLVPETRRPLFDHAEKAAITAKKDFHAPYQGCHEDKAVMHTYLAWQDEPGKPFGLSFEQGSFDAQDTPAVLFVDWIKRLFKPK